MKNKNMNNYGDYNYHNNSKKSEFTSNRGIKRYYVKYFKSIFDKDWWDCIELGDKVEIVNSFEINNFFWGNKNKDFWSTYMVFQSLDEWKKYIQDKYIPDKKLLREIKLKKIGF